MDDHDLLRARWATFAALILVFGFTFVSVASWNLWLAGLVALLVATLLTAVLEFWLRLSLRRAAAGQSAANSQTQLEQAKIKNQALLTLQQRFLEVRTTREIIEAILQVGVDFMGANGASFVPYDEWGKSLPALVHGRVPTQVYQAWEQRLSMPETRHACKNCKALHGDSGCVLLTNSSGSPLLRVECYPLVSEDRQAGVINFFLDENCELSAEKKAFISELLSSTGHALENQRRRDQEIAALLYLQTATTPRSDLNVLLNSLLESVLQALDVDFALLYLPTGVPEQGSGDQQVFSCVRGNHPADEQVSDTPFLEGVWKSVLASSQSLSLENVSLNKKEKWKAVLAVPLVWRGEEPAGVLVIGSNTTQDFASRHQVLLETLAGQAALLIQNKRLMAQVEFQAVVDERTRLAREIHDGLAQTLAFLKIQSSQMQNYLSRGEMEKLSSMLQSNYRTLSDAYIDARQAIDNLRRVPSTRLKDWIGQVANDFEQATLIKVNVIMDEFPVEYPANTQAQLIRIVQEALSNVRKHSGAKNVQIVGKQEDRMVVLDVRDDGCGFTPDGVEGRSRYGLVGMRERAESIGADFQITSQIGGGTVISLSLPAAVKEKL